MPILQDLMEFFSVSFGYSISESHATIKTRDAIPLAFTRAEFLSSLLTQNRQLSDKEFSLEIDLRYEEGILMSVTARDRQGIVPVFFILPAAGHIFHILLEQANASIRMFEYGPALLFR
ncbi:hypothetical protein [Marispirochaeta sp.]|uniref:hypothetical protein n=1 Tax=Marispirochaeta sp. TaxID=2038653 RepID=UPI0029C7D27C|nr:hypothetical protein [Marispirochaeta sp.]